MDYQADMTVSSIEQTVAQAILMNGQPQFSNQAIADVINTISEAIAYEHIHSGSEQVLGILDRALTMARGLLHD